MKLRIAISAIGILLTQLTIAQELSKEEYKKLSRQEKKEYRLKVAEDNNKTMIALLETREWVLEANTLQVKSGRTFQLNSSLNFLAVDNKTGYVQFGSTFAVGGNGVGGITLEGMVNRYEISPDKKASNPSMVQMNINGASTGNMDVFVSVTPSGNATATITDTWGNRLIYSGIIVPLDQSRVFKGTSRY